MDSTEDHDDVDLALHAPAQIQRPLIVVREHGDAEQVGLGRDDLPHHPVLHVEQARQRRNREVLRVVEERPVERELHLVAPALQRGGDRLERDVLRAHRREDHLQRHATLASPAIAIERRSDAARSRSRTAVQASSTSIDFMHTLSRQELFSLE